jgi:hypothetical protein
MLAKYFYKLGLVLAVFTALTHAENPSALYNSSHRPTVSEVAQQLTPFPTTNPFGTSASGNAATMANDFPKLIAAMEKAFPGVVWLPLGRDASTMGAAIEAFYEANGQKNRVKYLRGSGNSVRNINPQTLVNFLESTGLNLDPKKVKSNPPFVMIDVTGYGPTSQMKFLLDAAYTEFKSRGGKPEDLVRKFNAVRITNANDTNVVSAINPDTFLTQQEARVKSSQTYPDALMATGTNISYQTEWHGNFGPITKHADGWYADPAQAGVRSNQQTVLSETYEFMKVARDPKFLKDVQNEASNMGYSYPPKGVKFTPPKPPPPPKPKSDSQMKRELTALLTPMKAKDKARKGYSTNGRALQKWLQDNVTVNGNAAVLHFLHTVHKAKRAQNIGTQDIRSLIADALLAANIDAAFKRDLDTVIKDNSRVERTLTNDSDYFLQHGDPNVVKAYRSLLKSVPSLRSCHNALQKAGQI